ncbi:MAG: hypothetical protein HY692_02070 [Cyanobacteria bacterium NC_groundwater_1444_Ag_S-0.65um_54_12]|nr:hypothetical protein [Cyanobacteria bacterium NC_groundwater_1444_Ag_S-0.65um_54_12]
MLESCFFTLCRPSRAPAELRMGSAMAIWGLLALVLALPLSGQLGIGGWGAWGLSLLTFAVLQLSWFWLSSALTLLGKLLGGQGSAEATLGAIAQSAWPILLLPVAKGLERMGLLGAGVLELAIGLWVLILATFFLRRAHTLGWGRAILVWLMLGTLLAITPLLLLLLVAMLAVVFW